MPEIQAQPEERAEELAPKVHRLTVDLAGDEPAESRLSKAATAVCPTGHDRPDDEPMPPDSPSYRVWLVRCRQRQNLNGCTNSPIVRPQPCLPASAL